MRVFVGLTLALSLFAVANAQEEPAAATQGAAPTPTEKLDCTRLRNYLKCQVKAHVDGVKEVGQALREGRVPNVTVTPLPSQTGSTSGTGTKVYRAEDCIGPVVAGVCHGTVMPTAPAKTCYGTMLNGVCTGPMF